MNEPIAMARDDFTKKTIETLAKRVANRCSHPQCQAFTTGPHSDSSKSVNIGVAAHITAASPGGPRYDESLTPEKRKSPENGIWLCQNHAKEIDDDEESFPASLLRDWKLEAERKVNERLGSTCPGDALEDSKAQARGRRRTNPILRVISVSLPVVVIVLLCAVFIRPLALGTIGVELTDEKARKTIRQAQAFVGMLGQPTDETQLFTVQKTVEQIKKLVEQPLTPFLQISAYEGAASALAAESCLLYESESQSSSQVEHILENARLIHVYLDAMETNLQQGADEQNPFFFSNEKDALEEIKQWSILARMIAIASELCLVSQATELSTPNVLQYYALSDRLEKKTASQPKLLKKCESMFPRQ